MSFRHTLLLPEGRISVARMVIRDTPWPEGTPCWADLGTDDEGAALSFYGALFGWTGGLLNGRRAAGIGPVTPGRPAGWTTYLAVTDADAAAGRIVAAGGRVLTGPFDLADAARVAIAADPAGAVFGVWQARAHTGGQLANEPAALVWNEQRSADLEGSKRFYATVFGHTHDDTVDETGARPYAMFDVGGRAAGGLGELAGDRPAWWTYFEVPDADRACRRVGELGGQVLRPPLDSPYGRLAQLTDDRGAMFLVVQG
jgi:predicted enzyme related to lactoylglutathione lyase